MSETDSGFVEVADDELTDEEQALVAWAQEPPNPAVDAATTLRGDAAAAAGTAVLEAALGGPEQLRKAMRGRPRLDRSPAARGASPKRQVRLTQADNQWLEDFARTHGMSVSDVLRDAVGDFRRKHDSPAAAATPGARLR